MDGQFHFKHRRISALEKMEILDILGLCISSLPTAIVLGGCPLKLIAQRLKRRCRRKVYLLGLVGGGRVVGVVKWRGWMGAENLLALCCLVTPLREGCRDPLVAARPD